MKTFGVQVVFMAFLIVFVSITSANAWEGRVTRVLDGDSLLIKEGERVVTIRLYGIDSPEYGQPYWGEAKVATTDLVQGKNVTVEQVDIDQYGRVVALVTCRGRSLNGELVRLGLAWVYPRFCKSQPLCRGLEDLEKAARTRRLGIWQDRSPIQPWVWKHSRQ